MAVLKRDKFLVVSAALGAALLLFYFYGKDVNSENARRRAIEDAGKRAALAETHPEEIRTGAIRAQTLFNTGHREQAIALLQSLTKKYPQDALVHFALGGYLLTGANYSKDGKLENVYVFDASPDEGLAHIRKAAELMPTIRIYRYAYALQLSEHRRYKLAIAEFEKIFADGTIRKDETYRKLVINYADTLTAAGLRDRALEEYRKSLSVAPNDKPIADSYQALLGRK